MTTMDNCQDDALPSSPSQHHVAAAFAARMRAASRLLLLLDAACCLTLPAARVTRGTVARRHSLLRLSGGDSAEASQIAFAFKDDGMVCVVTMAIAEDVRAKEIVYDLSSRELTLGVKGDDALDVTPPMINAEALWGTVRKEDSHWEIDEIDGVGRCVVLELVKKGSEPWDFLLRSQYKPPDTTITCACSGSMSNPRRRPPLLA